MNAHRSCRRFWVGLPLLFGIPIVSALAAQDTPLPAVIHHMSETEVTAYLQELQTNTPSPANRIAQVAIRSVGQPYRAGAPMFSHKESDCVTFVEHALAMGLADSWESYCRLVARLRYADGQIPLAPGTFDVRDGRLIARNEQDQPTALLNRNLFTIAQWVPNNAWCFTDITTDLGEGRDIKPWIPLHHIARIRDRYAKDGVQVDAPDKKIVDAFIPREEVANLLPELRSGDVILFIVGTWENRYCDHMGILVIDPPNGDRPASLRTCVVHSAPPKVRKKPLLRVLQSFPRIQGIKVLRVRADVEQTAAEATSTMTERLPVSVSAGH